MKKTILLFILIVLCFHLDAQVLITTSQMNNINSSQGAFEGQIYKNTETNIFYIGLSGGTLKTIGDLNSISANSTLTGNGTTASPLGLAQLGATNGQVLVWNGTSWVPTNVAPATTTVSNTVTAPNSLTTTVNGTTGAAVNMVTGVSNTSSNNSLSTTVNGVIGANVNIINSISNSFAGGQLTTTVNGVNASPVTLPSGTVTNVTGTSPITVTNGTTTPNISITRNNIVAGTSSNTATNPLVLDAGATSAVVGGANATLTVNNTAPLWNANELQGRDISNNAPSNGQALVWNGTNWTPTNVTTGPTTVSLNYANNVLMATVNGTNSNQVNIINTVSNTSNNNSLSTTVNGITGSNVSIINSNQLELSGTQLLSRINGIGSNQIQLPVADGSETKLQNTATITYTGSGTNGTPYQLNANNTTALWNANQLQGNPVSSNSPSSGQVLSWNGSSWTPTTSTTGWSLTGNSGTAPATNFLGTTDAQRLVFRTNNTEKMTILSGGNVGIGATNPQNKLEITQGTAGNSGLRFTNLPNAGILATNSSGDVIIGKDIKDHHISRANSTSNVAPTSGEIPNPVNGYTAKVKLNNGIIEYWTYTSGAWTLNWSETQTVNGVDIGYIVGWTSNVTPPDYLLPLTGGTYNWSDFPHLQSFHASFPCQYIDSSTATTFTLVNINTSGRFLRGGTTAGTLQGYSTAAPIIPFALSNDTHSHTYNEFSFSQTTSNRGNYGSLTSVIRSITEIYTPTSTSSDSHSHTITSGGDSETRPINASVVWCIKVKPTSTTGNITINNNTLSETTTNLTQNTTTGQITYTNENSTNQTAQVVSTNANNSIQVGTDGGAFYQKDEIAIDIYNNLSSSQNITSSDTTLVLNTIRVDLGSAFSLSSNQVTVNNEGIYRITYSAGLTNSEFTGEYTGEFWLERNGTTIQSSNLYINCYNFSIACETRDIIIELSADDVIRIRMRTDTSNSVRTIPECSSINFEKIK